MDHYEVLGVRPNASSDEIGLAYKGRRSQYHPDRYATHDADTVAWATAKMQELNEAYATLSDPEQRARFDRARQQDGKPEAAADRASGSPGQAPRPAKDIASGLLRPDWNWQYDNVYVRPHIPARKLEGAISSYAPRVSPSEVIVLLDDTLFGGAREGLLVTGDAIYCKQKFENPRRFAIGTIERVEPGTDSRLMVNGREFFKADLIEHLTMLTFSARLGEAISKAVPRDEASHSASSDVPAAGMELLWRLHRGALAGLRTELEGEGFLVDDLIDRQMRNVIAQFAILRGAIERAPHRSGTPAGMDAEAAELALMLFLVLHYYAFSKLPAAFREGMGDALANLYAVSEIYKAVFREGFPLVFGRALDVSDEDLTMMSAVFFHRDGAGEFELNIPREEALAMLLARLQVPRDIARVLMRSFEDQAETWLEAFCKLLQDA